MTESFQITSDYELKQAVRHATQYGHNDDELPDDALEGHIDDAKRDLFLRTNVKKWYDDLGLGQALKALTCIYAKVAAENYPYDAYEFNEYSIEVNSQVKSESPQFTTWESQVNRALDNSVEADSGTVSFTNTSDYIG
jgi:hypothetical protein